MECRPPDRPLVTERSIVGLRDGKVLNLISVMDQWYVNYSNLSVIHTAILQAEGQAECVTPEHRVSAF